MKIPLKDAIVQLKAEIRQAMLESDREHIVFTPKEVELELSVGWDFESKLEGGGKVLALFDLSGEAGASRTHQHVVRIKLDVSGPDGSLNISDPERRRP